MFLVFFRESEVVFFIDDDRILVYVFGLKGVYIIDLECKMILFKIIEVDGICIKLNNWFFR